MEVSCRTRTKETVKSFSKKTKDEAVVEGQETGGEKRET